MSTRTESLSAPPPPATMAWVLDELPKLPGLKAQVRQNMSSSIRRLCAVIERSPEGVQADLRSLERLFERASPGALGLSPARWRNIKSDVRRAVKLCRKVQPAPDARVPLSDHWAALCGLGESPTERAMLRRFGRYCCARQIAPSQVTDRVMEDYARYLDEQVLSKAPERIRDDSVRSWNRRIAGDDFVRLTPVDRSRAYTLKWSDLPTSLKEDVDAWHKACLKPDPFDPDAPPPVRQSTIDERDRKVRRLATAVVRQGVPAEELTGLRALFTPERVKLALTFFLERNGGETSTQARLMAELSVTVAKHRLKLDDEEVREIKGWAKRLHRPQKDLTRKNKERLRQFRNRKVLRALYTLPERILARESRKPPDSRSALRVQMALAIAILTVAPMRIGNLRSLDRDRHFVHAFSDKDPVLQIGIDARDVKNGVDLFFAVSDHVKDLLEIYMTEYQPLLANGHPSTLLFPGRSGAPKAANTLRRNICGMIWRELGLHVHTHMFRHLAAHVFLKRHPGHYEEVRRILHHKNIQTTLNSYAGLEADAALARYDEIVLGLRKGPS